MSCRKCHEIKTSQCEYCTFKISCNMELCYHINTQHKDKVPKGWFSCSKCDWSYTSEEKLNAHKRCCTKGGQSNQNTKSSWIYCQYCPEVFVKNSQSFYFKHAKNFHFKDIKRDWFSCEECKDSIYPSKKILLNHKWYLKFLLPYFGVIHFRL